MTNRKNTQRALLSSVVALLLCFAMLLGTTFAYFTDSAVSGSNVITS
ncbi:MAG: SipW-dependent-type signal peptide-containing protein, partial [Clostridia bacterium]|nr:SipW-dependent-type signal peptide-containing protein [Clostridia bacterium]